jgi:guanylate kinase
MRTAERELEARGEFGHEVVNDRLEQATEALAGIVRRALETAPANLGGPDERTHP